MKTIQFDQEDPTSIAKMASKVGRVDILLTAVLWMGLEEMSDLEVIKRLT